MRLGIRVRAEVAEPTLARLLEVLEGGAEERALDGAVEYATYGAPAGLPDDARLLALAGDALLGVTRTPVDDGWATAYHAHLARVTVGAISVRPPWVAGAPDDLVIDPGESFGGGHHATTRLCLELLQTLEPSGPLCDWGTGSGVLAIAAARLGWGPVHAVDLAGGDLVAANAAGNGVEVRFAACDVTRELASPAPTVVANLTAPLLRAAMEVQPRPQIMIASGVLAGREDERWAVRARRQRDGWAAVVLA